MKKIILIICMFFLCGCVNLNSLSYDDIIANELKHPKKYNNIKRNGYNYTLLNGLKITEHNEYNDVIEDERNKFYLYVDIVSYYHKKEFQYKNNPNIYYSKAYEFDKKIGYLEINSIKNDKYLIEIMYNYAKIEVIVDEVEIKKALNDAISILSSITYNNNVIKNLMGNDILNFSEEEFNIFETSSTDNVLEMFETQENDKESIPDADLVK